MNPSKGSVKNEPGLPPLKGAQINPSPFEGGQGDVKSYEKKLYNSI